MRYFLIFLILVLAMPACATSDEDIDRTMELIDDWLGGTYDNSSQIAAEIDKNVPEENRHMPLHQVIMPVTIDGFDGLLFYQQLSNDGTTDTLLGVGLYHYYPDPVSGQVMLRFRMFNDTERFTNAHLDPSVLKSVALEDLHWTEGCEFYFSRNADDSELIGVMKENTCQPVSRRTGQKIRHVDELVIKPGQFWNNARYYDFSGNLIFGNATGEYLKQVRIAD